MNNTLTVRKLLSQSPRSKKSRAGQIPYYLYHSLCLSPLPVPLEGGGRGKGGAGFVSLSD
jgi:hypothetical protein